jgi:hypothetical protein
MEQTCSYPFEYSYTPQKDSIKSVSILWGGDNQQYTGSIESIKSVSANSGDDYVVSIFFLAFFILVLICSKEIINVYPSVIKAFFKLKNHIRLEERLAISNQRDIVTAVVVLYYPLLISLMFGDMIGSVYKIPPRIYLLISIAILTALWIVRKGMFCMLSWLTKDKNTFRFIEKISFNYLIVSVIFTFPAAFITFFWPDIPDLIILKILLYCCLFVFFIYLTKGFQIIISHRFSLFFYILYLCALELLPIALIANLILSF